MARYAPGLVLDPGSAVGRYVLFDQLGAGSMGVVYRAWDDALDRIVALKLLKPEVMRVRNAKARFLREARLAARINHPSVAHIYEIGEHDDTPFIAMEFVPGRTLRDDMTGPEDAQRVVFLARQILDGLSEAHRVGVVHRDLKPENIYLSGRDQVKILDFGLAKPMFEDPRIRLDSSSGITGTPRYMAPEQLSAKPVDGRTDLYAIGIVLYELLEGVAAHGGDSLADLVTSVVHRAPPTVSREDVPPPLKHVIHRAMSTDPRDRFETAESMRDALPHLVGSDSLADVAMAGPHLAHPRATTYAQRARDALIGFGEAPSNLALTMAKRAIDIDPDYALAHALHAEAAALAFNHGQGDATLLDSAEGSLAKAEALQPTLPDTMVARARILWNKTFNFPAETAMRELVRALKIDPEHAGALRMWANITGHLGLLDLTEAAIARRFATDPHDQIMTILTAGLHIQRGQPSEAVELLESVVALDPDHEDTAFWWLLAHAHLLAGDSARCAGLVAEAQQRRPEEPVLLALAGLRAAVDGDADEARAQADRAKGRIKSELHPHHASHHIACLYSILGDDDDATEWLTKTANEGFPCAPWFEVDPHLENLRGTNSGQRLLRELNRRHGYFEREFRISI